MENYSYSYDKNRNFFISSWSEGKLIKKRLYKTAKGYYYNFNNKRIYINDNIETGYYNSFCR